VGFDTSDDAGIFKLNNETVLVQTLDFITPVVDDPYTFGRISAINSLSDIYAMGGKPATAMSILMYNCDIDSEVISMMMQGACDEFAKCNCVLIGGHTVDDNEIKLGFSITGTVEENNFYKNIGLRNQDVLIYTKPLGIGIITTAIKGEIATEKDINFVENIMLQSNKTASELLKKYNISACTDVTGFGLAGHSFEMAKGSEKSIIFFTDKIPVIKESFEYSEMGIIPAGAYYNKQFLSGQYVYNFENNSKEIFLFDPQTSGGLLIGIHKNDADNLLKDLKNNGYEFSEIVGEVKDFNKNYLIFN
jgi:selenide,water dikinase